MNKKKTKWRFESTKNKSRENWNDLKTINDYLIKIKWWIIKRRDIFNLKKCKWL